MAEKRRTGKSLGKVMTIMLRCIFEVYPGLRISEWGGVEYAMVFVRTCINRDRYGVLRLREAGIGNGDYACENEMETVVKRNLKSGFKKIRQRRRDKRVARE